LLIKSALLCVPRRLRHRSSVLHPPSTSIPSCILYHARTILDLTMDRGLFGCQAERSVKICCQCCNLFIYFSLAFCCCCCCLVEHKNVHTSQHMDVGSSAGGGALSGMGGGRGAGATCAHCLFHTLIGPRALLCSPPDPLLV